ncbi:MAG: helix-turn-helix domain-containing protein [Lachnospiraceae bacterium]|nr:helix-turn-helix domain-containing protein [Lachnospiraceae bacterium]
MSRKKYENSENSATVDGTRITELRKRLHLSKTQLAIQIGYTSGQMTRAEAGRSAVSAELCERIASTYGVREEWLCGGDGEPWVEGSIWSGESQPLRDIAGERLREVYQDSGFSQREFCRKLGCATSGLNALMEGRREMTRRFAERVEREFDVGADWLLYGDETCKKWPCGEEMIGFLKKNPNVRREVWKQMKNGGQK